LNIADQAVEIPERLVQAPTKVLQLADPLLTIGEQARRST
jgi:hypothetical protein